MTPSLVHIGLVSLSFATNDFKFSKIILLCYGNAIAYALFSSLSWFMQEIQFIILSDDCLVVDARRGNAKCLCPHFVDSRKTCTKQLRCNYKTAAMPPQTPSDGNRICRRTFRNVKY
uniref:Uncharacterized protein n=1 Tax=Glossina austeni TaxID=7395 RepID=A0A1A9UGU0_GLOAU